jgi:hypothetical protein
MEKRKVAASQGCLSIYLNILQILLRFLTDTFVSQRYFAAMYMHPNSPVMPLGYSTAKRLKLCSHRKSPKALETVLKHEAENEGC